MREFKRKALQGVFPLMPLPIKTNDEIDYDAIEWNIDWLEQRGVPGFIKFGCMGAFNAVNEAEFDKVCDVCVRAARGKRRGLGAGVSGWPPRFGAAAGGRRPMRL